MTKDEFRSLELDKLYEFRLYYGDVKYGILVEDRADNKIFCIPTARIREYNDSPKDVESIGTEVRIDCISSWKILGPTPVKDGSIKIIGSPVVRKIIILGAGASYDSSYGLTDDNLRPPLANQLFTNRFDGALMRYPGAENFSSELALTNDLEGFFQQKWERLMKNHDPVTLSKIINVQYYLHDLFLQVSKKFDSHKRSNYNTLVNLVHDYTVTTGEHVAFVTFNYDLLLEQAMQRTLKYKFKSLDDYVNYKERKLLVFKPHGSCNFIRKLHPSIIDHIPSEYNMNSVTVLSQLLHSRNISYDTINGKLNGNFELFDRDEIIHASDTMELTLYLPQLLLPFKSKDDFIMPGDHSQLMDYFLSGIDEIIVIGWKGTEAKFQSLLNSKLQNREVKITTVTKGETSTKDEFSRSIPRAVYKPDGSTFSEYMEGIVSNNRQLFN